jgi:hypothetical protein
MSYEEAGELVVSMQQIPLNPAPRRVDDLLALLDITDNDQIQNSWRRCIVRDVSFSGCYGEI